MPRRPRLAFAGIPWHIVQRGVARSTCFRAPLDYERFLFELARRSRELDVAVHAYVLMTNHVHILVTPTSLDGCARLMKGVGQTYAQFFNRNYQRTGTLWEGRFRSSIVKSSAYVLACHRYIEQNPVRAGLVGHPRDYVWSSYLANAEGCRCPWLTPHPEYLGLAPAARRLLAYQRLFQENPSEIDDREFRAATRGNSPLEDRRLAAPISGSGDR
jgi:putative transposase